MYTFILPFLMGAPAGAEGAAPNPIATFLPLIAVVVIFYFLIIRPQNKKRKETEKMISALKKGDKVVTIGGLHGIIQNVKDTTVIVKVDDNVRLEFLRSAVSTVISSSSKEERIEEKEGSSESGE